MPVAKAKFPTHNLLSVDYGRVDRLLRTAVPMASSVAGKKGHEASRVRTSLRPYPAADLLVDFGFSRREDWGACS